MKKLGPCPICFNSPCTCKKVLDDGAEVPTGDVEKERKQDKQKKELQNAIENFSLIVQSLTFSAMVTKAKFDALVSQGFTKEEALFLCKEK